MNKQMNGIKITAAQEAKPHHDRISSLEKDIKQFVTEHRDELGGKKTKTLNFGETGFRKSTSVVIPKDKGACRGDHPPPEGEEAHRLYYHRGKSK